MPIPFAGRAGKAGLAGQAERYELVLENKGETVVMDIVYAPLNTRLLREAAARGCRTVNGLRMLLHQGVAQFRLWTGHNPPIEVMHQALVNALGDRTA